MRSNKKAIVGFPPTIALNFNQDFVLFAKNREMAEFKTGDRVSLPSGKIGAIVETDWDLPLHCLVQFPDGTKFHYMRRILTAIKNGAV